MSGEKPLQNKNILTRKMGEEWMLYDSSNESIHVINSTAEFVWRLCDGTHTVDDIKKELSKAYHVSGSIYRNKDIEDIIEKFYELGVLYH